MIAATFADRHGLGPRASLQLMAGDRILPFTIGGVLANEGPARVLDGNFVLMDIAAAQLAFDRLGRLDRIDVRLRDGLEVEEVRAAIAARLPPGLEARRPALRGEQVERMLASFHMNLTALSWIALVVGLFLVYNTITTSVVSRREEIGTLRALGVTRGQVLTLFLGEAAALGAVGAALGLPLARLLADGAVALTSSTVDTLYIATAAAPPALQGWHVALGVAIGVPLSLVAAAVPALEAAGVPPTAAIRGADVLETRFRLRPGLMVWPVVLLALAGWLATRGPVNGVPWFGYLAAFAIIAGAALLVPGVIFGLGRVTRPLLRRVFGVEGLLAHANLTSAIPRLSISVAALAVALSMMVAIAVMIGSFRETVSYWVSQTLQADLFIAPGLRGTHGVAQTISPDVVAAIAGHPDVEAVDAFRNSEITYNGQLVMLGSGNFGIVATHGSLLFKRQRTMGGVEVGHRPGRRYRVGSVREQNGHPARRRHRPCNRVRAPHVPRRRASTTTTPRARRIVMDRATFRRHYGELPINGLSVYLEPRPMPMRRGAATGGLDEGHRVFINTNRGLRAEVLRVFDNTFAITYALEVIAILVAILGVAGTLLTLVIERGAS